MKLYLVILTLSNCSLYMQPLETMILCQKHGIPQIPSEMTMGQMLCRGIIILFQVFGNRMDGWTRQLRAMPPHIMEHILIQRLKGSRLSA